MLIQEIIDNISVSVEEATENITVNITPVGMPGLRGKDFKFEDFTPEQLAMLKGERGESFKYEDFTPGQLALLKGDKGDAFVFEDFTPEQLEALKIKGDKGDSFTYEDFTPEQKDEVFNTFLSNFYDPSIVALHSRGNLEGAQFHVKLHNVQKELQDMLITDASLLMLPSGVKAGKLYSVLPEDGTGDFTVERNSTATRVNKDGLIETVPANVPRIDWSTGEPMLLVEESATNLGTNSDPTDSLQGAEGITIEAYNWTNGLKSSVKFNGGIAKTSFFKVGIVEPLKVYTLSAYVIMDDFSKPNFGPIGESTDGYMRIATISASEYRYENCGNNIWRVQCTVSLPSEIIASTANDVQKHPFQSNKGFRVSGWQLEEGSKATSYIPTNGSLVTRLADNIHNILPASGNVVITFADGTTQAISGNAGDPFTLPNGSIEKVEML